MLSDRIEIGTGATIGVAALVHCGTKISERGMLEGDSFLMKGSEVPDGARWRATRRWRSNAVGIFEELESEVRSTAASGRRCSTGRSGAGSMT
jgi:hypothetical protein